MLHSNSLLRMHDQATAHGHRQGQAQGPPAQRLASFPLLDPFLRLAFEQHRANFDLWHQEDKARDPLASDATIAEVKHAIDRLNQLRNDRVEQMDEMLIEEAGPQNPRAPLHSETPGLIIDRLSILALKIYHTAAEAHRATAGEAHRERNAGRLAILELQRADLAACLDQLWAEIVAGQRRFKLYRQMKMYNDPELNPVLYGAGGAAPSPGD